MDSNSVTRKKIIKAYGRYLRDMKWLRKEFGIIPEPKQFVLKDTLSAALAAVMSDDHDSVEKSLRAFEAFHKSLIYDVAWDLLEKTKESLKFIRKENHTLFEQKHNLWIQASWAFSEAIYKRQFHKYYDCITKAAQI